MKPKVLFIFRTGGYGTETAMLEGVLALPRRPFEASVCLLEPGPVEARWRERGVPVEVLPSRSRRAVPGRASVAQLSDYISTSGAAIVHAVGAAAHAGSGPAARKVGARAVWTQSRRASWSSLVHLRATMARADLIFAPTERLRAAQARLSKKRTRVELLPPGVLLPSGLPMERWATQRSRLGVHSGVFLAGSIGPFMPDDGHESFLRAAASLCRARASAQLLLLATNEGSMAQERASKLLALAADLGIGGRVRLLWPHDEPAAALGGCDVAVFSGTARDEIAMPVIQAMAAGVALVVPESGAAADLVQHGVTALVANTRDPEALAVVLLMLADDGARRHQLASAAEARAKLHYDAASTARILAERYRELME